MPGIVLGKDLAQKLGVSVGDSVQVLTPEGPLTPFGVSPRHATFKVVGIFSLGLYEFDTAYGFVHLSVAEKLLDRSASGLHRAAGRRHVRGAGGRRGDPERLGPDYEAQDWADMNKSLFSALWLEKMAMSITIGLIVMVAALNIIASLMLLVMEKTRDIAILKTMGSSAASIRRIFMLQGLVIGLVGTVAGAVGGYALIYILDRYKLIQHRDRRLSDLARAVQAEPLDFVVVVVSAMSDLLRRDHLSVAAGVEARSGAGAEVSMKLQLTPLNRLRCLHRSRSGSHQELPGRRARS